MGLMRIALTYGLYLTNQKCGFYQCRTIEGSAQDDAGIDSMPAEGELNVKGKSLDTNVSLQI